MSDTSAPPGSILSERVETTRVARTLVNRTARRAFSSLAALVAAAAALTAATGPAHARSIDTGARYVALGASYAAGPGLTPVLDEGCLRSSSNYPGQLADALGLSLVDVTCSGATTANILDKPQRLPGGPAMPPQIGAVTADTELVTITIGGNDLGMIGGMIARSCGPGLVGGIPVVPSLATQVCASVLGDSGEPTAADFDRVRQSIAEVVRTVRSKAPNATVLLVENIPVLDHDGTVCAKVPLSQPDAASARRTYDGLIAETRAAARETGVATVAIPNADDHNACAATPWTYGFNSPLDSDAPDVGLVATIASSYHPNAAGMSAVADQLVHTIGK
ncbi:SGNH/GDSL hydrolase family protein [Nocardia lijiangensis]|uniref:SGNH/GDSL hydrolase family protein n=1 Tax=Nocardia lijiangensis TaxID=299618 RepID=UPI0009FE273E|nr:SGNH/GDSL hydrolase family protein [Nocardia lijiangensis]